MAIEIERKFLIDTTKLPSLSQGVQFCQGYIQTVERVTVRVRVAEKNAYLTIKGPSDEAGLSRTEYEYPIPVVDAAEMLERLCGPTVIEKTRYAFEQNGYTWEVDVFAGANDGLIVAEVELRDAAEQPPLPEWIASEVTGDKRYYNSSLIACPWKDWPENRLA